MFVRTTPILILLISIANSSCFAQCGEPNANSPYGINFHAPAGTELTILADEAKNAGIGWIRVDFEWKYIEPSKGSFSWSRYDAIVAAANLRGLLIFGGLGGTPAWATSGSPTTGVPNNPADWYDFCYKVAERYDGNHGKGYIHCWGMWNEPNLSGFWEGTRQQYIDIILKNGANAIRAANPGAKVLGPELAHMSGSGRDWYYWLKDCIEQAGDKIDILTHHTYGSSYSTVRDRWEKSTVAGGDPDWWGTFEPSLKEVLQYCGWFGTGKPVWITEVGWQSADVGETNQASYYSSLLNDWFTGQSGRTWINKVFFYELNDCPDIWPEYSWGIVVIQGGAITHRKAAYTSYKNFITAHPATPAAPCQAASPSPAHTATGVSTTANLYWVAGKGATSHKVYFGTSNPPPYKTTTSGLTYNPGTLLPMTTYYWRIDEVGSGGTTTGTVWRFTTGAADTEPPSVPTGVSATALSSGSIKVQWTASTDNVGVTGYRVYRNSVSVGYTAMTNYTDAGLRPSTTYSYAVSAYDAQGNESAQSSPPAVATTPAGAGGQWLWEADNHSGSSGGYSSNWTDEVHIFTESRTSGGWSWNWNNPAASNVRLIGPGGSSGRSWLQSNSFGEEWSVDSGITVAARIKPVSLSGQGNIMLSVNNSSTADLNSQEDPGATSTHVWVGWKDEGSTDTVVFVTRAGTLLKQFNVSSAIRNTWCIWTLGAKQIGTTIAWDLWINGVHQNPVERASDDTYHTLVWSKSTDMGTSMVIGQRREQSTAHDTIWDYVGVTSYGVIPGWDGKSAAGDTQAPSVPANVTATAQSETTVQVNWTASTDNVGVAGYSIHRNNVQVGTSSTPGFLDTGLQPSASYSYTVSAYDAAGNASAQSSPPAVAVTPDNTAPSVPSDLQASMRLPGVIGLTWAASTDNVGVAGYKVFRNGSQTGTSDSTNFTDSGLTPDTVYTYTVAAFDNADNSSGESEPLAVSTVPVSDIAAAKLLPDSSPIGFLSKTVTAVFEHYLYIGETDRSAGIRVVPTDMPVGLTIGSIVDVGGSIESCGSGERCVVGSAIISSP